MSAFIDSLLESFTIADSINLVIEEAIEREIGDLSPETRKRVADQMKAAAALIPDYSMVRRQMAAARDEQKGRLIVDAIAASFDGQRRMLAMLGTALIELERSRRS